MTWSKFDDGYDEHERVQRAWDAHPRAVGLHVMATTACNRWLSDGVIRPKWLLHTLPAKKERERVLAVMVEVGLFDVLRAGTTLIVRDSDQNSIELGPFGEDRYVVHEFLAWHDSSVQVKDRRRKDAARKAKSRLSPGGVPADKTVTPCGHPAESAGSPGASRGGGRAGAQAHPDPTRPDPVSPHPQRGSRQPTSTLRGKGFA